MSIFLRLFLFTSILLVNFANNRVASALQLLQLFFKFFFSSLLMTFQPGLANFQSILNSGLFFLTQLISQFSGILHSILHTINVILQTILSINLLFLRLILIRELFSILQHLLNF